MDREANHKIAAPSRNTHIRGKEKTVAAKPVQEILTGGGAVCDCGYEMIANWCPRLVSGWGYKVSTHVFAQRFARLERRPKLEHWPLDQ